MRVSDKVFVHHAGGAKKEGTVLAIVGAGKSGFKQLVIATDGGVVGTEKSGTPHHHDRGDAETFWTQLNEDFTPKAEAKAVPAEKPKATSKAAVAA